LSTRASSALKSQKGIQTILFSGLRATVVMDEGKKLDQEKTSKAFTENGLALKSLNKQNSIIPAVTYTLTVSGTG